MTTGSGTPVWFELNVPDTGAAERFYTAITGWSVAQSPVAEHGGYRIASAPDGMPVAGMMTSPPGAPAFGGWAVYLGVDDTDAFAARVKALGGSVNFGPMDIPHVGRFAVCADPQGVVFFIMTGAGEDTSKAFLQMEGGGSLGHAVWIELATPDTDAAFVFYGDLFGWTKAGAMPMGPMGDYAFIGAGALNPGAIMSSTATGAPAGWTWYVEVADIDDAVEAVRANGGAVIQGPDQIPGGNYSVKLVDPQHYPFGMVGPRHGTRDE
ncbi:VOC family protein [Novosphingobium sp. Leaf2]|uniref:VOC family protein n=1 Tax=Novosphingobium sp. Leaf2 TaxID=1735670 RepID=UPI0006F9DDC3|nr:VOC family protein [Novosphingobium sp. Leaf2]KQM21550.1 glyoxalase [Novosphingobium sp. Leaf2]